MIEKWERVEFCRNVANAECTELGDGIGGLCCAANCLNDEEGEIALILAEKLCRELCSEIRNYPGEEHLQEIYEEITPEAWKYFTGGCAKLPLA